MNRIATSPESVDSRSDVLIDGRRLVEHIVGRRGAHPSLQFALGHSPQVLDQLLGQSPSALESGRIPVLVCEECGDVACGALAVRIERRATSIVWTDWAQENGYEPARALDWPTYPDRLEFELSDYENVLSGVLASNISLQADRER
jgi:hypothetical protein